MNSIKELKKRILKKKKIEKSEIKQIRDSFDLLKGNIKLLNKELKEKTNIKKIWKEIEPKTKHEHNEIKEFEVLIDKMTKVFNDDFQFLYNRIKEIQKILPEKANTDETFKAVMGAMNEIKVINEAIESIAKFNDRIDKKVSRIKQFTAKDRKSIIDEVKKLIASIPVYSGGGPSSFYKLDDTPSSYSGQQDKLATVNNDETGLEFRNYIERLNYIDFLLTNTVTGQEGRLFWNDDEGSLQVGMKGGTVNLQIGQESLIRVKASENITNGQIVRIIGGSGINPVASLAKADTLSNSINTLAMATEDIANNQLGYCTTFGLVRGLNTNSYPAGTMLYLSSSTSGGYTNTQPSDNVVKVGTVIRKSATEGIIFVSIRNYNFNGEVSIEKSQVGTDNFFKLVNSGAFANGGVSMLATQGAGNFDMAKVDIQPGAGYANSFYDIYVANSSKVLQNRLRIDVDGKINIGDGTNAYIKTDRVSASDLHVTTGAEKTVVYDTPPTLDERGALTGARLESPSSNLTYNTTEGSYTFDDSCTLSDYLSVNIQLNHDRKLTADLDVHMHWWQTSINIPNWIVQYRYQKQGASKTTSWTNLPYTVNVFTYTSGTLCQITDFGEITPPIGDGVSDILQFRIIRDTNNDSGEFGGSDPLTGDVDIYDFDVHKVLDTPGSRQEYVK